MIVSISQPAYLPWLGYFDRIFKSDLHIVLDNVQLERRGFTHRNKIRVGDSWSWLTVPLQIKNQYSDDMNIYHVNINNESNWKKKHHFIVFFSNLVKFFYKHWYQSLD